MHGAKVINLRSSGPECELGGTIFVLDQQGKGRHMTTRAEEPRSPHESESAVAELMMPQHTNNLGNVFGGVILAMVDRAATVAAMRHARRSCVTVSIDRVDFREPIYAGELVTCQALVNFVGRASMEVGVRATRRLEVGDRVTGARTP